MRCFVVLVGLLLLGGCTSTPAPVVPAQPTLPARPREVPVLGVDPCTLMPASVLADLRMDAPARVVPLPPQAPPTARSCSWERSLAQRPTAALSIGVVPQNTADYLAQPGAEQTEVAGFAAVQEPSYEMGEDHSCVIRVDVAPGQALMVSFYNDLGDEPGATHQLMCERAHRAAEGIMRHLLATTGN